MNSNSIKRMISYPSAISQGCDGLLNFGSEQPPRPILGAKDPHEYI